MSNPSASSPEGTYRRDIIVGTHGDKYQKDLTLVIFERATRGGYDFRLGIDMPMADKFDDIVYFDNSQNKWILLQVKHADTSKGMPRPLQFEMLYPAEEGMRLRGDFSIFKYLKSYLLVQANIAERKEVMIFTNRGFDVKSLQNSGLQAEAYQVDEILRMGFASRSYRFNATDSLIEEIVNFVNRDFNSLKHSIVQLFTEGIMTDTIRQFKAPLARMLIKTNNSVKFSEEHSPEANQLLTSLSSELDIRTVQLPLDRCRDLFVGSSRNRTLPLAVNEDAVRQFFQDFILCVQQPNDLRAILEQDIRSWMGTWIQQEYFTSSGEPQFDLSILRLENFINEKLSQVIKANDGSSHTKFLQLEDGEEILGKIKEDLNKQIRHLYNCNLADDNGDLR